MESFAEVPLLRLDTSENTFVTHPDDHQQYRVARDLITGAMYVRIAEVVPDPVDAGTRAAREKILAQNPVHFSSSISGFTGYWVKLDSDPTAPAAA